MANVLINETSLTGIADAIRTKKGVSTQYLPSEMGAEIASIQTFKPEETFNVTPTTSQQTITPSTGYVFSGGTVNPIYAEISTSAGMDATLASTNKGKMYKYTGTTDSNYTNGRLYIVEEDSLVKPLCFTANTAGSTVNLTKQGSPAWTGSYSIDGTTWNVYEPNTTGPITLANIGDKVYFKGDITADFVFYSDYLNFEMTGSISASGNVNSMYISTNFQDLTTLVYKYCYHLLFWANTSLISAPLLPATNLSEGCYLNMFNYCTSLVVPPELPAIHLAAYCYYCMFASCAALIMPPNLPATTMCASSYYMMFYNCPALITTPSLPATTLAWGCYRQMFAKCTSLTTLPALPAVELTESCYGGAQVSDGMFYGCTALQINDAPVSGVAEQPLRIPTTGTFTNTVEQTFMFTNCAGTRASDNMAGAQGQSYTYYTQNKPV